MILPALQTLTLQMRSRKAVRRSLLASTHANRVRHQAAAIRLAERALKAYHETSPADPRVTAVMELRVQTLRDDQAAVVAEHAEQRRRQGLRVVS